MCLAIPARILDIGPGPLPMAHARQADQTIQCCLAYVPEAAVGDYVLVQHGFAMEVLDEQSAQESIDAFASLGVDIVGTAASVS